MNALPHVTTGVLSKLYSSCSVGDRTNAPSGFLPSRCLIVLAQSAICASGDPALPSTGIALLRGQQLSSSKTCTTFVYALLQVPNEPQVPASCPHTDFPAHWFHATPGGMAATVMAAVVSLWLQS